jgi:hypothetical protein
MEKVGPQILNSYRKNTEALNIACFYETQID